MINNTIQLTVPRNLTRTKSTDFIVVEKKIWERNQKHLVELEHALRVISAGERELRLGKTRSIRSLRELM